MAETQPVILPPFWSGLIDSYGRKALAAAGAALATHGVMTTDQTALFVQVGLGVLTLAVSAALTYYDKRFAKKRLEIAAQPGVVNAATTNSQKAPVTLDSLVKAQ